MKLESIRPGKTYRINAEYHHGAVIIPKGTSVTVARVLNGKAWAKYRGDLVGIKPEYLS